MSRIPAAEIPHLLPHLSEDEQRELDVLLTAEIYEPHGACAEIQDHTDKEILIAGPAGTGKSRACLQKLHHASTTMPRIRSLIVRKTRESLSESALLTFERHVLGPDHPLLVDGPKRNFRQIYTYPNGSEIVLGGLDKASKIMSTEYDLIFVQEATELTEDDWESLTTRCRNGVLAYQQVMADCNPGPPTHWLKLRCDAGAAAMLMSKHEDNPRLWDGKNWTEFGKKYMATLDNLTGVRYLRLRKGIWAAAEGTVYEFNPSVHLIDRFDIPADWRRIRSIDFGYVNAFVCGWWAIDPDGRMYLYREIYMTERIAEDHGHLINKLSEGERIEATISDHDAGDRATLLRKCGIATRAADKDVSPGIQAVELRMRVAGDGRPRIMFMRDSLVERDERLIEAKLPWCTVQEFDSYCWKRNIDGRTTKEEPVKENDHGMDMTRYAVKYVDCNKREVRVW